MKTKEKKINRVEEWLSVAVLIAILILLSYPVSYTHLDVYKRQVQEQA